MNNKPVLNFEDGCDFARKACPTFIGSVFADDYAQKIQNAIHDLEVNMNSLKSNQTDASLGGFAAEVWHTDTFNINSISSLSKTSAHRPASTSYASADIVTDKGTEYSLKYYRTAELSLKKQAEYSHVTDQPKYAAQERLIPSDQLSEAERLSHRFQSKEHGNRPFMEKSYIDTREHLTDTVKEGHISSDELTKQESIDIAREIKDEGFKAEDHGINLSSKMNVTKASVEAGATAMLLSMSMDIASEITKGIYFLKANGYLEGLDLKESGKRLTENGGAAFMKGFTASLLHSACLSGKLGESLKNVSPQTTGTITFIVMNAIQDSYKCCKGKMNWDQMLCNTVHNTVIAISIKLVSQAIGSIVPAIGNLVATLISSALVCVADILASKLFIGLAVKHGFTFFHLVEQDYTLPDELLETMNLVFTERQTTTVLHTGLKTTSQLKANRQTVKLDTIEMKLVKRGLIAPRKVGYILV